MLCLCHATVGLFFVSAFAPGLSLSYLFVEWVPMPSQVCQWKPFWISFGNLCKKECVFVSGESSDGQNVMNFLCSTAQITETTQCFETIRFSDSRESHSKIKTNDESYCEDAIVRVVFNFSEFGEETLQKTRFFWKSVCAEERSGQQEKETDIFSSTDYS